MSLKQLLSILMRRLWVVVIVFSSVMVSSGSVLFIAPPRFDAEATATVDPTEVDPVTGQTTALTMMRVTQGNLMVLVRSQRVAAEVVRRLGLTTNPGLVERYRASGAAGRIDLTEWIAADLLRNLDARFIEGTNVLSITYRWSSAQLSAQLANVFLAAFIDEAIQIKVAGANKAAQWFEPQTEKLRAEVNELRARVSEFQRNAKLAPVGGSDPEMAQLTKVTNELGAANADKLKIESLLTEYEAAKGAEVPANPFDSPLLQSLRAILTKSSTDLSKLQAELGARHPRVLALETTMRSLQSQIDIEQKNARANLDARLASLNAQIVTLERARAEQIERLIDVQSQRAAMAELVSDLAIKQERLNAASRQNAAARLQGQLSFSNIAILDKAVAPAAPAFPNPAVVLPAAIAAGLGLGTILALIAEALDRRVRNFRDLEFAMAGPQLGTMVSTPVSRRARARQRKFMQLRFPQGAHGQRPEPPLGTARV